MNNHKIVDVTTKISIYTQLVVGLTNIYGLSIKLPDKHQILKDILILETFVQVLEFFWYVFIIQKLPQEDMARNRYYEWVFSTPLMLISMFSYLLYEQQLEKNPDDPPFRLSDVMKNYTDSVVQIVISNFLMLSAGYLYEIGKLQREIAVAYGFVFLVNAFYIMYAKAGNSRTGKIFLGVMFFLWSIYGVAFVLPTHIKNSTFNITDLLSKNFFEVYITVIAYNKRIKQ
jgi:hypothetical protein